MDNQTLRELGSKVSQYFLDFLESDFKRQNAPRRKITLQTEAGFRSGMKVAVYPGLHTALWNVLEATAGKGEIVRIAPKSYTRPMSAALWNVIREQILAISDDAIRSVHESLVQCATDTVAAAVDDPESWIEATRLSLAAAIGSYVVRPLLVFLDGPLSKHAYSSVDSIFSVESELIEAIATEMDTLLSEVLARLLTSRSAAELQSMAAATLTPDAVRQTLLDYFESYVTADAFLEFRDLDTYARTAEGKQLYLYLGSIKYAGGVYPIFFVPIDIMRGDGDFILKPTNHVYANKRALDFVLNETANRQRREWVSPVEERISYLKPEQSIFEVAAPLFDKIATALDLGGEISLTPRHDREAAHAELSLSTSLHLAVFDSADEALLNDYEEILAQIRKEEDGVVSLFEGIVRDVLSENPSSIGAAIDADWDGLPLAERFVFEAPIPLNEEQIKILRAVRHSDGKFILVEGPPGCGKSHTITAIAADCILEGRSCLVLSDKREALDVVQDKVSETMSKVRHDKDFPNPILRLGQQQSNFKKLISSQTIGKIGAYVKSAKANKTRVHAELDEKTSNLKESIARTAELLGQLSTKDIQAIFRLERELSDISPTLADEILDAIHPSALPFLEKLDNPSAPISQYLEELHRSGSASSAENLLRRARHDTVVSGLVANRTPGALDLFPQLTAAQVRWLESTLLQYDQLKMPVLGYLLRGSAVRAIERSIFADLAPIRPIRMKEDHGLLRRAVQEANRLVRALKASDLADDGFTESYKVLAGSKPPWPQAAAFASLIDSMLSSGSGVPSFLLGITSQSSFTKLWSLVIDYAKTWYGIEQTFARTPQFDYLGTKTELERIRTLLMNTEVDSRLVAYMDNYKADARALASVISQRQKFPEEKFDQVKESFPLILASIREFGEYMPLLPELFDVVVIDEASQVSIAQALPALLRAKKVVVLGDSKQFSNTKSANASIALNDKYRGDLLQFFTRTVSSKSDSLHRLGNFDVKKSVLDFVKSCANFEIMLRKHFRSYQELIGYSSKTFYGGQLQAIKVRGKPIGEVIRFSEVDSAQAKTTRVTNEAEGQFILERLKELLEQEKPPSVGVITPFREQQSYLSKLLFSDMLGPSFEDRLRLKVMTFDSCQGEEREVIFYSMVATAEHDSLNYIFPVEIGNAEEVVEEKLKAQRLNVGFSRAQETIWFVLSKPVDTYKGSIRGVLQHYKRTLETVPASPESTDPKSPMERRVLEWLHQTAFYQMHEQSIELVPQFPIGDYLRQLDPTYQHPAYKCDFLLTYSSERGRVRIIVEYDGFEFHFQKGVDVNVGNYERYLTEGDVERQLILESYGYRFLRINRFNLGKNPVLTLSERLERLAAEVLSEPTSKAVESTTTQAEGLSSKELKACTRCGKIKELSAFQDPSLKQGYGRICRTCKRQRR